MKLRSVVLILVAILLLNSCEYGPTDNTWMAQSITLTADPLTITTNQNLRLNAKVVFLVGPEGGPHLFSVRFLDGTKILAEGVVSNDKTVTKDIPVTKSMNGTLTIKAKVFYTNFPDPVNVDSQPVTVTINIP
jgi:hypothetical protein